MFLKNSKENEIHTAYYMQGDFFLTINNLKNKNNKFLKVKILKIL